MLNRKIAIWGVSISVIVSIGLSVLVYMTPVPEVPTYSILSNPFCEKLNTLHYQAQGLINSNVDLPYEFWELYARLLTLIDKRGCQWDI